MNTDYYEKLMLWIAGIDLIQENECENPSLVNRIKDSIGLAASTLSSQNRLWLEASARLSRDHVDFGEFELVRARNKLQLSKVLQELYDTASKAFDCPPIPTDNKICKRAAGIVVSDIIKGFIGINRTNNNPGIALPCGKIEDGESTQEAALREFLEETGLECIIKKDIPFVDFVGDTEVTMFYGAVQIYEKNVFLKPSHEGTPGWYTKEEMLKGPYGDFNLKAFRHFELF